MMSEASSSPGLSTPGGSADSPYYGVNPFFPWPFIHSSARRSLLVFYSFLVHSYKTESDIFFCKVFNKIDTKYVL